MNEATLKYVCKALSEQNRKPFDGDSNAPFQIQISMAEVGPHADEDGGFWMELKIPKQIDNCLGMSIVETFNDRKEAVSILRELADLLFFY